MRLMILSQACAIGLLLLGGWTMDLAYAGHDRGAFFSCRIRALNGFPYWFLSALALSIVNGFYLFRLAALEGGIRTPPGSGQWGRYSLWLPINPLRMVAVDLVAIPVLLILSVLFRQHCW